MAQAPPLRRPYSGMAVVALLNLGYAAFISWLALTPNPPGFGGAFDWLFHATAFGVQAALLYSLCRRFWSPVISLLAAGAASIAYGSLIEVLQLGVPGRLFEVSDLVANACGVALSAAVLATSEWSRRRIASRETPR
jgi:VanZ family protein